jgi:hypothetical protein
MVLRAAAGALDRPSSEIASRKFLSVTESKEPAVPLPF